MTTDHILNDTKEMVSLVSMGNQGNDNLHKIFFFP